MKKIIPLLVIFFISLYLLLVSIVATSHLDLQAKSPEGEFSVATLDTFLGSTNPVIETPVFNISETESRKKIPDYISDIRTKIIKNPALKKHIGLFDAGSARLTSTFASLDLKLRPVYTDLYNKKRHFETYVGQLKANAHLKFANNASGLSNKEKNGYYSSIVNEFNQVLMKNTLYFNSAVGEVVNATEEVKNFTDEKINQLQSLSAHLSDSATVDTALFNVQPVAQANIKIPTLSAAPFEGDRNISAIPDYDKNGYEWGWLGQISSWLIKPNSYDLVLIVGMVGFGLFGAAISIFINKSQFDPQVSIFENIVNTMIKGFAAAIVIFLATKGGIAILNTGTNKPNPYVLFITCLIGSVFSQPVWDWAKDYISNAYKGGAGGSARGSSKAAAINSSSASSDSTANGNTVASGTASSVRHDHAPE